MAEAHPQLDGYAGLELISSLIRTTQHQQARATESGTTVVAMRKPRQSLLQVRQLHVNPWGGQACALATFEAVHPSQLQRMPLPARQCQCDQKAIRTMKKSKDTNILNT